MVHVLIHSWKWSGRGGENVFETTDWGVVVTNPVNKSSILVLLIGRLKALSRRFLHRWCNLFVDAKRGLVFYGVMQGWVSHILEEALSCGS